MRINNKILTLLFIAAIAMSTGCRKYLDINTNPNVAQDAPEELLLPSAQLYLASAVGVDLQVNGSIWAQYWTQSPASSQYKILEQYSPSASTYDRVWGLLYSSCLTDLNQMEKKGRANNKAQYVALAKLLKAYAFQIITDGWGDVPYSQALKGLPEDGGITAPKFDPQQQIYDSLIAMVQQARTLMTGLTAEQSIDGDLIYGGHINSWQRFANTLELKMFLRLSERNPAKAQAGVAHVMSTAGTTGGFIEEGQDAQINFSSTSGNQNPLYSEIVGLQRIQNLVGSKTVIDSMNGLGQAWYDWRVEVLFSPTSSGWVGLAQGNYTAPPSTIVSPPSPNVGANANDAGSALAPVKFMTSYESYFLQAEAVARGWATGDAKSLFEEGISASFGSYSAAFDALDETIIDTPDAINGVPLTAPLRLSAQTAADIYINGLETDSLGVVIEPAYWAQYPSGGTVQQKVRHIITQKWFSMTGNQGFEAWTEWRRTGYPDFFVVSANSIIGKTPASFPRRFFYPDVEVQRNLNFPGQRLITDRVWWDVH